MTRLSLLILGSAILLTGCGSGDSLPEADSMSTNTQGQLRSGSSDPKKKLNESAAINGENTTTPP